jgi:hypothetical protein
MSVLDDRDEECCICGSYHTKFVCWKCYQEAAKGESDDLRHQIKNPRTIRSPRKSLKKKQDISDMDKAMILMAHSR